MAGARSRAQTTLHRHLLPAAWNVQQSCFEFCWPTTSSATAMATTVLYTKFTPHRTLAIREGLRLLRNVFASDASKEGLTTHELYKLALKEKPGKEFLDSIKQEEKERVKTAATPGAVAGSSLNGKDSPPEPPNPKHPLKSMSCACSVSYVLV